MRRGWWAVVAAFVVLFLGYQLPEGVGIHLLGRPDVQAVLLLLFYPVALLVAHWLGWRGFGAFALELHRGWTRNLGLMLAVALLAKAGAVAIGLGLCVYAREPTAGLPPDAALALLGIVFTTFFPSVAEDIVTRGFWFRQLPRLGRGVMFVLLSSALYVLNHVYRLQNGPTEWLMLFAFGLAYATALVRTGSLWAVVGLHWGWNIAAFATSSVFGVATVGESVSPLLSAAAHLAMLAAVFALSPLLALSTAPSAEHGPHPRAVAHGTPDCASR